MRWKRGSTAGFRVERVLRDGGVVAIVARPAECAAAGTQGTMHRFSSSPPGLWR